MIQKEGQIDAEEKLWSQKIASQEGRSSPALPSEVVGNADIDSTVAHLDYY